MPSFGPPVAQGSRRRFTSYRSVSRRGQPSHRIQSRLGHAARSPPRHVSTHSKRPEPRSNDGRHQPREYRHHAADLQVVFELVPARTHYQDRAFVRNRSAERGGDADGQSHHKGLRVNPGFLRHLIRQWRQDEATAAFSIRCVSTTASSWITTALGSGWKQKTTRQHAG